MTYQAKVIAGGKIVIPAELRREIGIKDGDSLIIERDESGHLVLKTYRQVTQEVQAFFRKAVGGPNGSAVDELIAERQAEAARDDIAHKDWAAKGG
ncbi:AbrB family looped-hinge helix DNA binding protein [Sphingomonas vulcanisoli]|uniref:AbrB family looped-hinge helix DNA binding protein n=1 Tax=Sphingomonas vulcanisoli TaxID=1658060 RepID=A0ABX0TLN2_9SPHN|nr:AbrB/MazE/SpoVT family DNA-binding domain-containing protein [Sphingomonas vulcanisoli]NIJ06427.1 AbrB family looped-hinge helix DNA binding protein [Sphingomonas vulcanisoli]